MQLVIKVLKAFGHVSRAESASNLLPYKAI